VSAPATIPASRRVVQPLRERGVARHGDARQQVVVAAEDLRSAVQPDVAAVLERP
jgi:hypothetical protein